MPPRSPGIWPHTASPAAMSSRAMAPRAAAPRSISPIPKATGSSSRGQWRADGARSSIVRPRRACRAADDFVRQVRNRHSYRTAAAAAAARRRRGADLCPVQQLGGGALARSAAVALYDRRRPRLRARRGGSAAGRRRGKIRDHFGRQLDRRHWHKDAAGEPSAARGGTQFRLLARTALLGQGLYDRGGARSGAARLRHQGGRRDLLRRLCRQQRFAARAGQGRLRMGWPDYVALPAARGGIPARQHNAHARAIRGAAAVILSDASPLRVNCQPPLARSAASNLSPNSCSSSALMSLTAQKLRSDELQRRMLKPWIFSTFAPRSKPAACATNRLMTWVRRR